MVLGITILFLVLFLGIVGIGVFIWIKQRHVSGFTLRITTLAFIELVNVSVLISVYGHPFYVILTVVFSFVVVFLLIARILYAQLTK